MSVSWRLMFWASLFSETFLGLTQTDIHCFVTSNWRSSWACCSHSGACSRCPCTKEHLAVPSIELEWQLLSKGLVSNHASEWWQSLLPYNVTNSMRQPVALRWWNMVLQLSGGFYLFLNHHIWLVFLFWQYILLNLTFCLGWEVDMNNNVSI